MFWWVLGLGCDNWNLFVAVEGGWVLALRWRRGGGGGEIRVTNYLVHFTPFLSVNFKVEKMSDVSVCFKTALT